MLCDSLPSPLFLLPNFPLLLPYLGQYIWIPPLPHIRMALHSIRQRRVTQMSPPPLRKGEFHVIHPVYPSLPPYFCSHFHYLIWDIDRFKRSIVAHTLEERDAKARTLARGWGKYTVGGAGTDAMGEGFKTLADGYDEGARYWRAVDPIAREVLCLKTMVVGGLKEIGCQHGVFVWADALLGSLVGGKAGEIWVLDYLEFVLLVRVEEAGEGRGGKTEGFCYKRGECGGKGGHLAHVRLEGRTEHREVIWVRPLIR